MSGRGRTRSPFNSRVSEASIRKLFLPFFFFFFLTNLSYRAIQNFPGYFSSLGIHPAGSWNDKSSRFDGSSNYYTSSRRRQLGKLVPHRELRRRVRGRGHHGYSVCSFVVEQQRGGRICEIRTTDRRAYRRRLESRVHPPEEFWSRRDSNYVKYRHELALTPWQPTLNFYPRYRCASLNSQNIFAVEGVILILSGITNTFFFFFCFSSR